MFGTRRSPPVFLFFEVVMRAQNGPFFSYDRVSRLSLGFCVALVACQAKGPPAGAPEADSEVLARVGGASLTKHEFDRVVERSMVRYAAQGRTLPPQIVAHLKESILAQMIDDAIIYERAHQLGIQVDQTEVDAKFAEHKSRFRSSDSFEEYLRRSSNTADALKEDLRNNLLHERVIAQLSGEVAISESEVAQYYAANLKNFVEPEQIRARRILLLMPPEATPKVRRLVEREANRISFLVTRGKKEFGEVAKERGQGPEATQDGDLGAITPGYVPELGKLIVEGLEEGRVSHIVRERQGLALYLLEQRHPERQRPLAEVSETILNSLTMRRRNERRQDVLRKLKDEAQVEVYARFEVPSQASEQTAPTPQAPSAAVSG